MARITVAMRVMIRQGAASLVLMALAGCVWDSRSQVLAPGTGAADARAMQSRVFPTSDQAMAMHAVEQALRSLDFGIDTTDNALGIVSGTSRQNPDVHITVTIRVNDGASLLIRANGNRFGEAVSEAQAYDQFFAELGRSMNLRGVPAT